MKNNHGFYLKIWFYRLSQLDDFNCCMNLKDLLQIQILSIDNLFFLI